MQKQPMVKDWLGEFLERVWPAVAGQPWSRDDRECRRIWSDWLNALMDRNASRVETELAASRLQGQELESPSAWLEAIVIEIGLVREAAAMPPPPSERDAAQDASRDCPHCGGEGLVIIDGSRSTVAAHCVCPMGRWMRGRTAQDMIRRIPDYADHLRDRSELAATALRDFYDAGWAFVWSEDDQLFRTHRGRPDAPPVSLGLTNRCRELRREIYDLLGHPIMDDDEVMNMDDFRDADGKFDWRKMVAAIAERGKPTTPIHAPSRT